MRILLINPPLPVLPYEPNHASPPLGLSYMAAELIRHGYSPYILDCVLEGYEQIITDDNSVTAYGLSFNDIISRITEIEPGLIGISCLFSTLDHIIRRLSKRIKSQFPDIPIVLGGNHPTVFHSEFIEEKYIDFVIRGEGDVALKELVEALEGKRDFQQVTNLTYKEGAEIISTQQVFIEKMDDIVFPARQLLDLEKYVKIGKMHGESKIGARATTIITSRGCPANCIFCSIHPVWGYKFRSHSPEYVIEEIKHLMGEYGINHIIFEDDNITYDKDRAKKIFQGIINERLNITWTVPNGVAVRHLDKELLSLMKRSGCHRLSLAVESGCQQTLDKIIKKPLQLDEVERVVAYCKELSIATTAFFVVGFPGETGEMIIESMKYAENLNVDTVSVMIATPYPGTKLHDICIEKGFFDDGFQFHKLTPHYSLISTDDFSSKNIERIIQKTVIGHALKNPFKVLKRVFEKFLTAPGATFSKIFRYMFSALKNYL